MLKQVNVLFPFQEEIPGKRLPQKTMVILANFVPQSPRDLKLVKGMGAKKSVKYGKELLDIIISYCT